MSDETPRVRTRYAPSPTGKQHIGGIRTAFFAWLWARHNDGDFLLRIEDTDQARFREDALQDLFESLAWLGLDYDEGPEGPDAPPNEYYQTQRAPRYEEVAQQLLDADAAYECYCSEERLAALREAQLANKQPTGYDRHCRDLSADEREAAAATCAAEGRTPVVRFKVPLAGQTTVHDAIRGSWTVDNETLEDYILLKSDGLPTYHLGHLVDDHDMRITHVMRGVEYVPTAPLHVLMHEALGWTPPIYAHMPLILDPEGKGKMSKRKQNADGSVTEYMTMVHEFRDAGYVREALLNYLALLGWSVAPDRDLADLDEIIEKFDIYDVKKSPAAFNYEKLNSFNGEYINNRLDLDVLVERVAPFMERAGLPADRARLRQIVPTIRTQMKFLTEAPALLDFFLVEPEAPNVADLPGRKMDAAQTREALQAARDALADVAWSLEAIDETLRATAEAQGLKAGQLFQPIRVALTSRKVSPGIFETVYHVGRDAVLHRLDRAIALLEAETQASTA